MKPVFRVARVLLMLLTAGAATIHAPSALAEATSPAAAALHPDRFLDAGNGWQTYVNGRYGMQLSYPADLFAPMEPPRGGEGRRFAGEHLQMEVFAWENEAGENAWSLAASLIGTEGYQEVFIEATDGRRLVLSGNREGRVFYELYLFERQTIQALGMEVPVGFHDAYGPLMEAITETFVHGEAPDLVLAGPPRPDWCPPYRSCKASVAATRPPLAFAAYLDPAWGLAPSLAGRFGAGIQWREEFAILSATRAGGAQLIVAANGSAKKVGAGRSAGKLSKSKGKPQAAKARRGSVAKAGGKPEKRVAGARKKGGKSADRARGRNGKGERGRGGGGRGGRGDRGGGGKGGDKGGGKGGGRGNR